jgi:hypothetical protein
MVDRCPKTTPDPVAQTLQIRQARDRFDACVGHIGALQQQLFQTFHRGNPTQPFIRHAGQIQT